VGCYSAFRNALPSPVVSIYAGDLVSFSQPDPAELSAIHALLDIFGPASSLRTNYVNCSAPPVRYSPEEVAMVATTLACPSLRIPGVLSWHPFCLWVSQQPIVDRILRNYPPGAHGVDVKRWSHSNGDMVWSVLSSHPHLMVLSAQMKVIHSGCNKPWNSYAI
jgi:hypothetical protein